MCLLFGYNASYKVVCRRGWLCIPEIFELYFAKRTCWKDEQFAYCWPLSNNSKPLFLKRSSRTMTAAAWMQWMWRLWTNTYRVNFLSHNTSARNYSPAGWLENKCATISGHLQQKLQFTSISQKTWGLNNEMNEKLWVLPHHIIHKVMFYHLNRSLMDLLF